MPFLIYFFYYNALLQSKVWPQLKTADQRPVLLTLSQYGLTLNQYTNPHSVVIFKNISYGQAQFNMT